ncbi:NADPH-dependent FMN reductase, partial [Mesorhizobium sp.]|uniref:NADPH-dependent FMN reductase n=1 Tax=Mesorhizobium sp. TaxID=1871066 RepID=UPI0025B89D24
EYNYFVAPAIVNAVDYLSREWKYKPAAIFSYGGVSGGLRAAQAVKPLLTSVGVMPIPGGVALPLYQKLLESDGSFRRASRCRAAPRPCWTSCCAGARR